VPGLEVAFHVSILLKVGTSQMHYEKNSSFEGCSFGRGDYPAKRRHLAAERLNTVASGQSLPLYRSDSDQIQTVDREI
jgi:hypothetical protein